MPENFSNPNQSDEYGIVGFSNNLSPEMLTEAYSKGVYPWPMKEIPMIPWFCPQKRGVLFLKDLHVSKSLKRAKNQNFFRFTINQAFDRVIEHCASVPRILPNGQNEETWITRDMIKAYQILHTLGRAHSIEAWSKDRLVGGVYGVCVQGVFAGESMFHHESNASKLALLYLLEHLKAKKAHFMDTQMVTPVTESFGAKLIDRQSFLDLLRQEQSRSLSLF